MRVALVTEYYAPTVGGIQEHVFHLRRELVRLGHEVTIVTSRVDEPGLPPTPPEREEGVVRLARSLPVVMNGSVARVSVGLGLREALARLHAERRFDVLHVHAPLSPTLPLVALRAIDAPAVGTFHTYFEKSALLRLLRRPLQRVLDRLSARVAVSPLAAEALQRYFTAGFTVIPNGVDCARFAAGRPRPELAGRTNVVFVSRLEPRCGLPALVDAMRLLPRSLGARLVVVGDGPLRAAYEARAEGLDVVFAGAQSAQVPDFYASATVVCVPFAIASFGITLLEAMAAGRPLVASDIAGFRTVMTDGAEGRLVEPGSPRAIASALEAMLSSEVQRARYAEAGRETARRYDWPLVARRIAATYAEVA